MPCRRRRRSSPVYPLLDCVVLVSDRMFGVWIGRWRAAAGDVFVEWLCLVVRHVIAQQDAPTLLHVEFNLSG